MAVLSNKHSEVVKAFNEGKFVVNKTEKVFSSIPIDQQNNVLIKADGGAVGLTHNPSALRRWMVAGPEVARVIEEFHNTINGEGIRQFITMIKYKVSKLLFQRISALLLVQ